MIQIDAAVVLFKVNAAGGLSRANQSVFTSVAEAMETQTEEGIYIPFHANKLTIKEDQPQLMDPGYTDTDFVMPESDPEFDQTLETLRQKKIEYYGTGIIERKIGMDQVPSVFRADVKADITRRLELLEHEQQQVNEQRTNQNSQAGQTDQG